ncbi:MAG: hypothetical protein IK076_04050 [Bacteroidales bacterium]|nr:hypothetical protein [Bacteroidales bacterium]
MRKLIITIASLILLALLGLAGISFLKNSNPRKKVISPSGSTIIIEELSYYLGGEKVFGKVFKPAGEDGSFDESSGQFPAFIFLHEPLKTDWPESVVKSLVPSGILGYTNGFRGSVKDIVRLVNRVRKEKYVQQEMLFLACDASSCDETILAVEKLGHRIQGLILIEPNPTGKAREIYQRYGKEFLTIGSAEKGKAVGLIEDYLEERGALK